MWMCFPPMAITMTNSPVTYDQGSRWATILGYDGCYDSGSVPTAIGAKIGNIPESCKDLFAKKAQNIWWFQKK